MSLPIRMSASAKGTSTSELIASILFDGNQSNLTAWVEQTQKRIEASTEPTIIEPILLPSHLPQNRGKPFATSMTQLCKRVASTGFAVYEWSDKPGDVNTAVSDLLQALSLRDGDQGVMRETSELSLLQDLTGTPKGRFPPYQSKPMNWHTDGYYNDAAQMVRCFTLHCVSPAAVGGALLLMDDAYLVYALLKEDPELVVLLCHPNAMTLPHNKDNEGHDRPDRCVPVILQNTDQTIAMRFTTRTRNIHWRCNATKAAAQRASELINVHSEWHTRITLQQGQGIITRNVLHAREAFEDAPDKPKRQILRGRYTNLPTPAALSGSTHSLRGL